MEATRVKEKEILRDRNKEVGLRLRRIRQSRGLLQKAVAEQIDVSKNVLCAIESGRRKMTYAEMEKLSEFYHIPVEEILKGKEEMSNDKIFIGAFNSLSDESKKDVLKYIEYKQYVDGNMNVKRD